MELAPFDLEAARRLPENLLFGTSSWIYPGWKGLVYHGWYRSERDFHTHCLEEYARFPWFRTVGIDGSYYKPPATATLQRYAAQLPAGFPWVAKVWQELTIARFPRHRSQGARAGEDNPRFLDPRLFHEHVLPPFAQPECAPHAGPFVLQFQAMPQDAWPVERFVERLDTFLRAMPPELRFAVEVRNSGILVPEYFGVLNAHGATHCFNHWTHMPRLLDQMRAAAAAGGLRAPFYVARLLTPRGVRYADAVERFQPYLDVKEPIDTMRDDAVRLAARATDRGVRAFIMVNNRSEGNAPRTIDAIGTRFLEEGDVPLVTEERAG